MSKEPDPGPGGEASLPQTSREVRDLQDQSEQQQVLISQLKEMLRKEQSTVPQEKVDEYINNLSKAKAKKSRLKKDESGSVERSGSSMDSRKHEKVNLMKQQLEENKVKLAERGMRQKNIEEMVTAIKTELNDSQQIINATPLNLSSLEKNLEYNKNTGPEELYNILLVKERKISDLLDKTQKQEGTILDLQENLKEKDQVIDARTKAITLMSDNLSKKGKDALDALDDTKEQMRKMQENFITLESEMKARQMILLNDLKTKNMEIADLQEQNEKIVEEKNELIKNSNLPEKSESDNHEVIIKDLQQKLANSKSTVEEYTVKITELQSKLQELQEPSVQSQNPEVEKLKKQLDESNKNMIKVKAQNKSKIKELNKKLDAFKKMSDANAMIVQLQSEITKLNENIAELEEEKGNMQLKMVESIESLKGSTHADDMKELQDKLTRNSEELYEKDKVITLLESDIISLKTEITNLAEKNSSLSQLQNEQVTSEIKSIQIEEQLESLQSDNGKLQEEIEVLRKDKDELLEKIEEFNKERMDLTTKLDNYVQENMELIDKLEKLSAEKVSSAESIEIVEGLTQQDKLELAAYQKHMETNLEEPTKAVEEELPAELNESALQLTEDSTELLNRIEMFNVERKEVMTKMDALRDENNQLSLKLNEIENNRDILAETYEQVQTEKDELQKENEELAQKLKDLEDIRLPSKETEQDNEAFSKLQDVQKQYEKILEENNAFKSSLKDLDAKVHEKDNLETELTESKEKIFELESKLKENLEEITNYQTIIEENKTELINYANIINQLQAQLSEREADIKDLNVLMNDLNNVVTDLQSANNKLGNFEVMENQVDELKRSLNEQVEYAQAQAEEFKEELAFNRLETEKRIEEKIRANEKLSKELLYKEEIITDLQQQLDEKDSRVHAVIEDMKQKYLGLQKQLDNNSVSFKTQVEDLSTKNREQLEKMKKIAANLKKKTQAYQELEKKYNGEKEKWETEVNRKETGINEVTSLQSELEALREEIKSKSASLETSDSRIKELTDIIDTFKQQNVDLQNMLLEARQRQEKVTDVSLKQELSTSLHEEFDNLHGNNESTNEDKIKELELIIETNEGELSHYKERSQKLEEDLAALVEEKDNLLIKSRDLEEQLRLMSRNVEEKAILEREMDEKLQEVAANDDALTRNLEELQMENRELSDKNREQEQLITKLKVKIKKVQEKVSQLKTLQANVEEQDQINSELKKQLAQLEASQKHAQLENEEMQKQNQRDYERIEADYQMQLEGLLRSRNELTFECEKLEETVKSLKEREEELILENNDFKQKLQDLENEYNNQITKLTENLNHTESNWQNSVQRIESLQAELETLQKQIITDTAKQTVENVLSQAKVKVVDFNTKVTQTENAPTEVSQNVQEIDHSSVQLDTPTVQWEKEPQGGNNWFDDNEFPAPAPQQQFTVTKEDLESKIKALEVLLYNVDKEKEEVVRECSDMLNELTRLVYEKVNTHNRTDIHPSMASEVGNLPAASGLESQIMSLGDIDAAKDPHKLQNLEFERADTYLGPQTQPVADAVGPPTSAYLTYQPEQPISEIDSQIMSMEDVDSIRDPVKLQQLEFERSDTALGQQSFPVVERLAQPSKAYLTYQVGEAIGENDDGWGWGPEEARLEEEHQYRAENTPQVQALKSELSELSVKLQTLQAEKETHLKEIEQLQVKSGKLMKKCKELKLKNDELTKKSDKNDFFDLDQTIQEELKTQLEQLEKRIKETNVELDKEKLEKANILKRVDVLTAANEKMMDMKEIQDYEVLKWKRKYEETQNTFGWGASEFQEPETKKEEVIASGSKQPSPKPQSKDLPEDASEDIEELKKLVNDLTVDNEELQALLDDQKQQRVQLERSKSIGHETRMSNLEEELRNKEYQINRIIQERDQTVQQIKKELSEKNDRIKIMQEKLEKIESEGVKEEAIIDFQKTIGERNATIKEIEERLAQNMEDKDKIIVKIEEELSRKTAIIQHLKENLNQLQAINEKLQASLTEQSKQLKNNTQLEELKTLLMEKTALADQFKYSNDTLHQQIQALSQELEHLKNEFTNLEANSTQIIKHLQAQIELQQTGKSPDETSPTVQELTENRANSVKELFDLFNREHDNFEELKLAYEEICQLNNTNMETVKRLEEELADQKQQYQSLQALTAKNILELQTELEESKQKLDQVQVENVTKCSELEEIGKDIDVTEGKDGDLQEVAQLQAALSEKDANVQELKKVIDYLREQQGDLEGEIKQLKDGLNGKQVELDRIVGEMENKLVDTISELEEKWATQVDERGNTVAESWKYHLTIVESDFAALQEKLKNEINELDEKCNGLVNENNELRRNVDAEIKNEVDRISALQQQINDRQSSINELNQLLASEQMEKSALAKQVSDSDKIQQLLADKEVELTSLKTLAETTRRQFDEKRDVIEEIVKILERNTSFPLSYEKQDILNEMQRQLSLSSDKNQEVENLNSQLQTLNSQLQNYYTALQEKEVEVSILKEETAQLQSCYDTIREKEADILRLTEETTQLQSYYVVAQEKDAEILRLKEEIAQLQSCYDTIQEKETEILRLKEEITQLQSYYVFAQEKDAEISRLKEEIAQLQSYCNTIQVKDLEILRLSEFVSNLQAQLGNASDKDQEITRLSQNCEKLKIQLQQLEEKEIEIVRLQGTVEEYKLHLNTNQRELLNLQQQNNETNHTLEDYKQKLEEFRQTHISLQNSIEDKNRQISALNQQLQVTTNNKEAQKLENELAQSKDDYSGLQQSLAECQQQLFNITQDLATKSHECQTVSQQLAYSQQNAELLQGEVNRLNEALHMKEHEYALSVENIEKTNFKELESHYEEIMAVKDFDIQTLRAQVAESVYNANEHSGVRIDLENQVKQLEEQILEHWRVRKELESRVKQLEEKLAEQSSLTEEETKQLSEMRGIIEEQVVKIEELKKELFEKSNDYDSLIAEMDISRNAITHQPVSAGSRTESQSEPPPQRQPIPEDDLSEPVNRAELDLALYMLHQRDVRCEELTVELTHLLEERDTLQLRLSNAIREKEDLRRKYTGVTSSTEQPASTSVDPGTPKSSRTSEIFLAASGTELASEPLENMSVETSLASKLSELKQVGYKRDKTFVDEQDLRRMQQMSIMQQHIRDASRLPPEAAAKLVDASYTLSRDVQSPSKVLLNWLWGNSTPRVNDT